MTEFSTNDSFKTSPNETLKSAFAGETITGNCDTLPFEKKSKK
ncbi:MAG: hypothetical protein ABJN69_07450 [Hellea sp.]